MLKEPMRNLSDARTEGALNSHKMRARAAGGQGEMRSELGPLAPLFQTQPEDVLAAQPRHVITVGDITRGLGLDGATSDRVQRAVATSNVSYSPKAGQQRLAQGRGMLLDVMRAAIPDVDKRDEIMRRALAFWRKTQSTDGTRSPTMRAVIKSDRFFGTTPEKPLVIPLRKSSDGHKYKRRMPDGKGGWRYVYDDEHGRQSTQLEKPKKRAGKPYISIEGEGADRVVKDHASKEEAHAYGTALRAQGKTAFVHSAADAKKYGLDPRPAKGK